MKDVKRQAKRKRRANTPQMQMDRPKSDKAGHMAVRLGNCRVKRGKRGRRCFRKARGDQNGTHEGCSVQRETIQILSVTCLKRKALTAMNQYSMQKNPCAMRRGPRLLS